MAFRVFILLTLGLVAIKTAAAEGSYYDRFLEASAKQKGFLGDTSLVDTNNLGPVLTNAALSFSRFAEHGELEGVRLGMTMSEVVEAWGKPRQLFTHCFMYRASNIRTDLAFNYVLPQGSTARAEHLSSIAVCFEEEAAMKRPVEPRGCTNCGCAASVSFHFGIEHAPRTMQPKITYNDAWESVPLEYVDEVIDFFNHKLQPTHPLRSFKLFPVAKCWRRHKYLVEEEEPSDILWVLDMERKKRIRGKTCYYFKRIETQAELDAMLRADYEAWVQYMKDAGAWQGA